MLGCVVNVDKMKSVAGNNSTKALHQPGCRGKGTHGLETCAEIKRRDPGPMPQSLEMNNPWPMSSIRRLAMQKTGVEVGWLGHGCSKANTNLSAIRCKSCRLPAIRHAAFHHESFSAVLRCYRLHLSPCLKSLRCPTFFCARPFYHFP